MIILVPGWVLVQGQWLYRRCGRSWVPVALIDRVHGAIYPLQRGITRETVARVLGRAA